MLRIKRFSHVIDRIDTQKQGITAYHHFNEFIYWKKGYGSYTVDGKTYRYNKGFFVNIPQGIPHATVKEITGETILLHYDNTDPDFPLPAEVFKCTPEYLPYIDNIIKEVENATPYTSAAISAHLTMLFVQINRERLKNSDVPDSIIDTLNYIHNNFSNQIALRDLADLCQYSVNNYLYLFKKAMNCTPMEYLLKKRLSNAVTMLLSTSMGISEIALACGFYDTSHFSRNFKKHYGISPLKYRAEHIFYQK